MERADPFWRHHRGGSGAIVLGTAYGPPTDVVKRQEQTGVFSSIELAQAWSDHLGDEWLCIFVPYIVDDPDWGNEGG